MLKSQEESYIKMLKEINIMFNNYYKPIIIKNKILKTKNYYFK